MDKLTGAGSGATRRQRNGTNRLLNPPARKRPRRGLFLPYQPRHPPAAAGERAEHYARLFRPAAAREAACLNDPFAALSRLQPGGRRVHPRAAGPARAVRYRRRSRAAAAAGGRSGVEAPAGAEPLARGAAAAAPGDQRLAAGDDPCGAASAARLCPLAVAAGRRLRRALRPLSQRARQADPLSRPARN